MEGKEWRRNNKAKWNGIDSFGNSFVLSRKFQARIHILGFCLGFFLFFRFVWRVCICAWLICCVPFFTLILLYLFIIVLQSRFGIFSEWMVINSVKVTINICSGVNSNQTDKFIWQRTLFYNNIKYYFFFWSMIHMSSRLTASEFSDWKCTYIVCSVSCVFAKIHYPLLPFEWCGFRTVY